MSENNENLGKIQISRRDFMKLLGAGSLFVGLGAIGIPSILKNIKLREQLQQIQLMLQEQV